MAFAFKTKNVYTLPIADGAGLSGTKLNIQTKIDAQSLLFTFDWNGLFFFYTVTISRGDGTVIKQWIPTIDEPIFIENFNEDDSSIPDAMLVLADLTNQEKPIYPFRLGQTHTVIIFTGEIRKL